MAQIAFLKDNKQVRLLKFILKQIIQPIIYTYVNNVIYLYTQAQVLNATNGTNIKHITKTRVVLLLY